MDESFQGAVLAELREHRKLLERKIDDHDVRLAVLERRSDRRSTIVSAATSIVVAVLAAMGGCSVG